MTEPESTKPSREYREFLDAHRRCEIALERLRTALELTPAPPPKEPVEQ